MADEDEAVVFVRVPRSVKARLDAQLPARKRAPWVRDLLTSALDELERDHPMLSDGRSPAA